MKANLADWVNDSGMRWMEHIAWIAENPDVPRLRDGGYRRVNLKIFPYYVSYVVRDAVIWILAVAHGHTLPEYWINRP